MSEAFNPEKVERIEFCGMCGNCEIEPRVSAADYDKLLELYRRKVPGPTWKTIELRKVCRCGHMGSQHWRGKEFLHCGACDCPKFVEGP